jgi:hypothetical protein
MKKLKYESLYHIRSRGPVYTIDLEENNLPPYRKEWIKLLNESVEIDGKIWKVIGIESFPMGHEYAHQQIALLVKERGPK